MVHGNDALDRVERIPTPASRPSIQARPLAPTTLNWSSSDTPASDGIAQSVWSEPMAPGREAQRDRDRVDLAVAGDTRPARLRVDAVDRARQPLQQVQAVDGVLVGEAGVVGEGTTLVIGREGMAREVDQPAQPAIVDRGMQRHPARIEAIRVADHQPPRMRRLQRDHRIRALQRVGDRLLAEHVEATLQRGADGRLVERLRRRDEQRLEAWRVERLVERGGEGDTRRRSGSRRRVDVAADREVRQHGRREDLGVLAAHHPHADERHPDPAGSCQGSMPASRGRPNSVGNMSSLRL